MKNVLVIANPYPPMVSAGTRRVLRFLRHLPEYGWRPSVLTARATGDDRGPGDVPTERAITLLPERLLRGGPRIARLNLLLFVPDAAVAWVPAAILKGSGMMRRRSFDAVFSSSPRASVHLVAAALSRLHQVPWLADYRDPWLNYEYRTYPTRLHRALHARLEAAVLKQAGGLSAINDVILQDVLDREPRLAATARVIANGFDGDETAASVKLEDGHWFVHTGRLYGRLDQTTAFLRAFATLPPDARMLFLGVEERVIAPIAARLGIPGRVQTRAFAPHEVSLGLQRAADVLVVIAGRQAETTTSKVFEYLTAGRPIFALAPEGSAVQQLLAATGAGETAADDADLPARLRAFYERVRNGEATGARPDALAAYDARNLTGQLAALLDVVASRHTRTEPAA